MREILVILEDLADGAAELAAAARSVGEARVTAAIFGGGDVEWESLSRIFDRVVHFPSASGDSNTGPSEASATIANGPAWDAEYMAAALLPWIHAENPQLVLMMHSNNGLDLAPMLAAKCDRPMLADCLSLQIRADGLAAVQTRFGGKVHARVVAADLGNGFLATLRPGAFDPATATVEDNAPASIGSAVENTAPAPASIGSAVENTAPAPASTSGAAENTVPASTSSGGVIESGPPPENFTARRRTIETVAPEPGAVDITQAEILVAVGRGIEEEENLEIVQSLAEALGAELACTRPIVDKQWLQKSRQVGTSGQTVKPKIYLTVGVSGSFQHLGGVKGAPFLIAINQDPAAPIFASADVGIVGDLFDIVPLIEEKVREYKGS